MLGLIRAGLLLIVPEFVIAYHLPALVEGNVDHRIVRTIGPSGNENLPPQLDSPGF
jgi:hypothetical protein